MGTGKKKIDIKPIANYQSRMVSFTRRRNGLFRRAKFVEEKFKKTISIVVISETGQPYHYGSPTLLERYYASTTTAASSSRATSSSTTTAGPGSSTTIGVLEELKDWVNSEVEACNTSKEAAESLKRKLSEIEKRVDNKLFESDLQFLN
ncbi:agamous-like MADS-box protein AGL29 [Argentina anserina]|uniref:agamous-like MADS-box protein AGL29 n=1 Tax=Argentina anserina TaxID=57926 RepID=UPI0021762A11|nr:agamous-like MADS-box protein AGL29 [Potentilla anserina]